MSSIIIGVTVVATGCSFDPGGGNSNIQPVTPVPTSSSSSAIPSVLPSPSEKTVEKTADEIPWDLYPGLQAKLDGLVQDRKCPELNELRQKYESDESVVLRDYITESMRKAECN